MKAQTARDVVTFTDIPNVGPAMARDFELLGLKKPEDLKTKNAFDLYKRMCRLTGFRQDPCVLDTYMSAIAFMKGAPVRPWWYYTKIRKKEYADV